MSRETVAAWWGPAWLWTHEPSSIRHWLACWEVTKARPETLRLAASMVRTGFTDEGRQVQPKALSVIAREGECSTSSVERFLAKAKAGGFLEAVGYVLLVQGKRATPMYQLTTPRQSARDAIPKAVRGELAWLAAWSLRAEREGQIWPEVTAIQPTWFPEVRDISSEPMAA